MDISLLSALVYLHQAQETLCEERYRDRDGTKCGCATSTCQLRRHRHLIQQCIGVEVDRFDPEHVTDAIEGILALLHLRKAEG